jgi:dipeptidyl aminopeptidase/acylaminoacyl peptidase
MAVRFDPDTLRQAGTAVRVLDAGMLDMTSGAASVAVSSGGTIAYVPGGPMPLDTMTLAWVDKQGATTPISDDHHTFAYPSLSPDGSRLAVVIRAALDDIWICDSNRGAFTRLTFALGNNWAPVWTPNGQRVIFASTRADGVLNLYWKSADGGGPEERLTTAPTTQVPTSVTPDGRTLAFSQADAKNGFDLWLLTLADRRATPFLQTQFNDRQAMFSPDGRWVAYTSDESGHDEVYIRPFPGPGSRTPVSVGGGSDPRWRRDGRELFYRNGDIVMSSNITVEPHVIAAPPRPMASVNSIASGFGLDYDVAADGRRIVGLIDRGVPTTVPELHVVLGWFKDLNQKMSADR